VAGKRERQRKLARDAHQRRMERQAQRARRAKQIAVSAIVAVIVAAVGIGVALIANHGPGNKANASANSSSSPTGAPSASAPASPSPTPTPSPSNTAAMVNGTCVYIKSGAAARRVNPPPAKPNTKARYVATIKTNRGSIVIDLLNSKAPCTVGSFVSLATQHFYDKTPCPRVTTTGIYVLQCGDPTGTGSGGPGYAFGNENLTGATYPADTVAMANSGAPDSNGSQFFLVYKKTPLPPNYTPFGTVVSGLNIIQNVAKAGSDNSNPAGGGHPKEKVQIESVTIKKT
jgi:peptidyl-prolyl cis-trans isomerase B (cyclophilin B)